MAKKTTQADIQAAEAEIEARFEERATFEDENEDGDAYDPDFDTVLDVADDEPETEAEAFAAHLAAVEAVEAAGDVQQAIDAWNQIADRLYELEHTMHRRDSLRMSRLGRLLERLP